MPIVLNPQTAPKTNTLSCIMFSAQVQKMSHNCDRHSEKQMIVENLKLLIVLFCEVQFSACQTAEDRESCDVSGLFTLQCDV